MLKMLLQNNRVHKRSRNSRAENRGNSPASEAKMLNNLNGQHHNSRVARHSVLRRLVPQALRRLASMPISA